MSDTNVAFANGQSIAVPSDTAEFILGLDEHGDLIARTEADIQPLFFFLLTPCCFASGKGSYSDERDEGIVVCRNCYREVSPKFGSALTERDIVVAVVS